MIAKLNITKISLIASILSLLILFYFLIDIFFIMIGYKAEFYDSIFFWTVLLNPLVFVLSSLDIARYLQLKLIKDIEDEPELIIMKNKRINLSVVALLVSVFCAIIHLYCIVPVDWSQPVK